MDDYSEEVQPVILEAYSKEYEYKRRILEFERQTKSNFIVRHQDPGFGCTDWMEFQSKNYKRYSWNTRSVPFDGVPFLNLGRKVLECHMGTNKNPKQKKKAQDEAFNQGRLQKTKKVECPAKIFIFHIVKFADFAVEEGATLRLRKLQMKKLHKYFEEGCGISAQEYFYLQLPDPSDHCGHPTDGIAATMSEKPDPAVVEYIVKKASEGVLKLSEMKKHIDTFVKKNFGDEYSKNRRRFYPLNHDIRNYIKKGHRASIGSKNNYPIPSIKTEEIDDSSIFEGKEEIIVEIPYCEDTVVESNNYRTIFKPRSIYENADNENCKISTTEEIVETEDSNVNEVEDSEITHINLAIARDSVDNLIQFCEASIESDIRAFYKKFMQFRNLIIQKQYKEVDNAKRLRIR